MILRLFALVSFVLVLASCSSSQLDQAASVSSLDKMSYEKQLEFFPEISFEELQEKITAGVAVVDVNHPSTFNKGHIPSAQNFSLNKEKLAEILPADKSSEVIAYCGSPTCTAWLSGAKAIYELGYTNVKHFHGGLAGWVEAGGQLEAATQAKG